MAAALALCLATLFPFATCSAQLAAGPPSSDPPIPSQAIAIVGANVIPMTREVVLKNYTVVIKDGRIEAVGPARSTPIPAGSQRISGAGRWVIPGLAEMHGHIPGPEDPAYAEDVLFLYVSNGVTTVRTMAGRPSHLPLRRRVMAGELIGPTMYIAAGLSSDRVKTPEQASQAVRDYRAEGYDLLGESFNLTPEAYTAMANTAREIGMRFAGHVPEKIGFTGAIAAKQDIEHLDSYVEFLVPPTANVAGIDHGLMGSGWARFADENRIPDAVRRTLAAGIWNVPTLSVIERMASPESEETLMALPEMRYVPRKVADNWVLYRRQFRSQPYAQPANLRALLALRSKLTLALHKAGAPMTLGSDAPQIFNVPGFSIHHEMRLLVAAGISPYQVLLMGTHLPAVYFGAPEAFGTIEAGRRADLLLLKANPLKNIANVERRAGVMVRGRWLPEEEIEARLGAIARNLAEAH